MLRHEQLRASRASWLDVAGDRAGHKSSCRSFDARNTHRQEHQAQAAAAEPNVDSLLRAGYPTARSCLHNNLFRPNSAERPFSPPAIIRRAPSAGTPVMTVIAWGGDGALVAASSIVIACPTWPLPGEVTYKGSPVATTGGACWTSNIAERRNAERPNAQGKVYRRRSGTDGNRNRRTGGREVALFI